MMSVYPEYVNTSLIKTLQSTKTTAQESSVWSKGWDEVKRAFPLGYCGNPAKIEIKKAKDFEDKLVEQITNAILQ
jgi:creatinine amidohydrolase